MTDQPLNILVLCTGNSARSILGEVLLNDLSDGRLRAYSAGSRPVGQVHPGALRKLRMEGHAEPDVASESWDRFSAEDAPKMDIVITVCDNAAAESCPVWNGAPVTVHWGIPDPAGVDDTNASFDKAYDGLRRRIEMMLELPLENFDSRMRRESLQRIHDAIRDEG